MPNAQELWQDFISSAGNSNTRSRAMRQFVGRDELIKLYFELMARAQEEQFSGYYVVNFYGEPGIGKSTLLRQIENRLYSEVKAAKENKKKPPVILRADFDNPALSSVQDVLGLFRAQLLSQVSGAAFPFFDMAIHLLAQKQGRRLLSDEEKELLTDNPVLSFAMGTVADMVGLGTVLGAFQAALQVKDSAISFLRDRKKYILRTYEEIQQLDAPDLIRRLPWYFAMDVNATKNLPALFVFLDTYERAAGQADSVGYNAGFDESWLTGPDGLIANLGNAVFAIAGREPLFCEEENGRHIIRVNANTGRSELRQQKLDVLSEAESRALLTGCGMSDELAGPVCRLTGGDPVFLELYLDQYDQLTAIGKTPTLDDLGMDTARLVERHTRYLPDHLKETLFLLAAMGRWTDAQYDAIRETARLPNCPIPDSADYRRLTGLSYVWPEGDEWTMRDTVAEVLSRKLTFGPRSIVLDKIISLAAAEEEAFRLAAAEAWYALAFHMWETHRDTLPFSRQCAFLRDWGGVCDELQKQMMLNEREKRRYAQSGEKAWALLLELCENEQNTQNKPTPDSCRAQYELGWHYWKAQEWKPCITHFQQAAEGYRELGKAWSVYAMTAEGAVHAARDLANNLKPSPETDGFDWEYEWTGTETAEDLELLQSWAYFRINSCNCNIDTYYSLMRKIAGAYRALDAKPSRSTLAAEIQTISLYVQQQLDPQLVVKCALWSSEHPGPGGEEWDWDTPLFRDCNTGAETAKTCMELVERVKRLLSPADPLIADALDALAQAQEGQCLYHLAIPVRQEALALSLSAYGPDAIDTLNREEKLIDAYRKAGKPGDAVRLQEKRLEHARETMDASHQGKELVRTADLYRLLLSSASGEEQLREYLAALGGLLEKLRALPGTVFEDSVVPWGRAAIWCLNHAEKDVEPDTRRFVSTVVDFCRDIPHTVFYVMNDGTVAQVILEGMEEESGWRYDLWEQYWPDEEGV